MDSQGESVDTMEPLPVNTAEEIRRTVREELHRRTGHLPLIVLKDLKLS